MPQPDLEKILHDTLAKFNSETGTIHRLHEPTRWLRLVAQVGLPPQLLDVVKVIPAGKGIAGQVIAKGQPVTLGNLQTDTSGGGSTLCVPIREGDKIIGTLGIGTSREHEYTPEETRALEEIGRSLGAHLGAS